MRLEKGFFSSLILRAVLILKFEQKKERRAGWRNPTTCSGSMRGEISISITRNGGMGYCEQFRTEEVEEGYIEK